MKREGIGPEVLTDSDRIHCSSLDANHCCGRDSFSTCRIGSCLCSQWQANIGTVCVRRRMDCCCFSFRLQRRCDRNFPPVWDDCCAVASWNSRFQLFGAGEFCGCICEYYCQYQCHDVQWIGNGKVVWLFVTAELLAPRGAESLIADREL